MGEVMAATITMAHIGGPPGLFPDFFCLFSNNLGSHLSNFSRSKDGTKSD